jgi:uncharacterized protein YggE
MNPHLRVFDVTSSVRLLATCLAVLAASSMAATVLADEGILVRGTGSATGRPSQIEMSATLSGEAELAADAMVKFHDAKRRALAAIAGLKDPDLSVESGGVSVGSGTDANTQMMMMQGMAVPNTPQKVRLTETSRIVLIHTDKLEPEEMLSKVLKILDVAKDSGFQIGPAPARNYYEMQIRAQQGDGSATVSFKLPDTSALRDRAYKAAIDDAKAKAQRLAELSGAKLGRIISVHDEGVGSSDSENASMVRYVYGMRAGKEGEERSIAGSNSGDLTLGASLTVQFEIAK